MCDAWSEVPPSGTELFTYRPKDEPVAVGDERSESFGTDTYRVRIIAVKPSTYFTDRNQVTMVVVA